MRQLQRDDSTMRESVYVAHGASQVDSRSSSSRRTTLARGGHPHIELINESVGQNRQFDTSSATTIYNGEVDYSDAYMADT